MPSLDELIEEIVAREGGYKYENVPGDRGGPTKGGITLSRLRDERSQDVTAEDVRNLTPDEIKDIYRRKYYYGPKIDRLPDFIEPVVMDFYTTSGTWALKSLQRVIRQFGYDCDLDGKIGPQTIRLAFDLANNVPMDVIVNAYCHERARFYRQIWENDASQKKFARGWNNRAMAFLIENRAFAAAEDIGETDAA